MVLTESDSNPYVIAARLVDFHVRFPALFASSRVTTAPARSDMQSPPYSPISSPARSPSSISAPSYSDISAAASPSAESAATYIKSKPSHSPEPPSGPPPINPQMSIQPPSTQPPPNPPPLAESTGKNLPAVRTRTPSTKAKENAAILEIYRRRRANLARRPPQDLKPVRDRKSKTSPAPALSTVNTGRVAKSDPAGTEKPKVPRIKITYKGYQSDLNLKALNMAVRGLPEDATLEEILHERDLWLVMLDIKARPLRMEMS